MCLAAGDPSAQCLRHGFMLHTKYQVVYPFPTFQPAFQLKKDQVVLLNTSYSLVACAVSVHSAGRSRPASPILFRGQTRRPGREGSSLRDTAGRWEGWVSMFSDCIVPT